jgi:hypothetical protein
LSPQKRPWAGDGRYLWIESLAMGSREIDDCCFDFRHTGAAVPASGEVDMNLSGATGWEFAVRREK